MEPPFDGSAEDDLRRYQEYQRDQDAFFEEQEDKRRHSQARSDAEALAKKLERAGIDAEPILRLRPELLKLGLLSKMSKTEAEQWAASVTLNAFHLRLRGRN